MARQTYPWEAEGEALVLETPEHTKIEYRLADFGARIHAALIDRLVILGALLLLFLPILLFGNAGGPFLIGMAVAGYFLFSIFYFVWVELRGEGRTLGKRSCRLRTVSASGRGLTLGGALVRNLARLVDEIPLFWIVPILSDGRRRIGDFLAGTFVITEARHDLGASRRSWYEKLAPSYRELEERRFVLPSTAVDKLYPEDLSLIDYLDGNLRRLRSQGERRRLLSGISEKYIERLGIAHMRDDILADPQRFLGELGLFLRDRFEGHPA